MQESHEFKKQRLHDDRIRHANTRNQESDESREDRLQDDRIRHANTRNQESDQSRSRRLRNDQIRKTTGRNSLWQGKYNSGFEYDPNVSYSTEAEIGSMTDVCKYCKALKWKEESTGICCSGGKVRLDPIEQPPEPLQSLLCRDHIYSQHFLNNIRRYNSAFQMTSFGAKEVNEGNFMPTFKVQGQVYHLIGSLLPKNNQRESFLQIYFLSDYKQQRDTRLHHFPVLNASLLECLQSMLDETNPYVRDFKTALQLLPTDSNECNYKIVINADHRPSTEHRGRHNEPATNEVSILLVDQQCDKRDIILHRKNDSLQRIAETHRSYDALQYPLMFVRGEDGYHITINQVNPNTAEQIDDVISVELPDKEDDPELFEIVKTHMVHGPCGAHNPQYPCMKNGICSKKFPKTFTTETVTGED
ncbi:uncharacterized protein [Bactrocera oleae]|uniref:uncharacterized protein n=1 Tax=Bactrocera oleae TaxID=104688 RepID=UPI00387E483F